MFVEYLKLVHILKKKGKKTLYREILPDALNVMQLVQLGVLSHFFDTMDSVVLLLISGFQLSIH